MTNTDPAEGEGCALVASSDTNRVEGLTAIADLKPGTKANVMAVCTCEPWRIAKNLWKTRVADASGQINLTTRGPAFSFKPKDVIAGHSLLVKGYRDTCQLVIAHDSNVTVNPEPNEEVTKLKEWYQNKVSQLKAERLKEGFTPIANLTVKTTINVLAVCTRNPWQIGKAMWKTLLRDTSGQVVSMKRGSGFGFQRSDVIAIYAVNVGEFKGSPELEVRRFDSQIDVNPELPEASQLREWYKNQVSQVEDKTITRIADLKKNTTANILAVSTSDSMERTTFGPRRQVWQATLRDESGYMNVVKDESNFTFGLNDVIEAHGVFVREFILGTEIVMDANTVVTVNPATEEANKLKEWYQTQGIRECVKLTEIESKRMGMKLAEVVQNQMLKRPNHRLKCDVCNVWCPGSAAYNNHVAGRNHQNNIVSLGLDRKNGTDEASPAKKPRISDDPNAIVCNVCDIFVIGQVTYDAHIHGKSHAKNLRKIETAEFISQYPDIEEVPGKGLQEYKCKLCQVNLGSKVSILNHLNGAKHTKKAKSVGAPTPAPVATVKTDVQPPIQNAADDAPKDVEMKTE